MRNMTIVSVGLALSAALLAGCSKPAAEDAKDSAAAVASDAAATASSAAADAASGAAQVGGAVSPPQSPQNDAVNGDGNAAEATQTPGSNSFTQGQAQGQIEKAGYTDVSGLMKTPEGLWTGTAKKDGKPVAVSVDFKGAVSVR